MSPFSIFESVGSGSSRSEIEILKLYQNGASVVALLVSISRSGFRLLGNLYISLQSLLLPVNLSQMYSGAVWRWSWSIPVSSYSSRYQLLMHVKNQIRVMKLQKNTQSIRELVVGKIPWSSSGCLNGMPCDVLCKIVYIEGDPKAHLKNYR